MMGFFVFWQSQTSAERTSLSFHLSEVTSHGCTMRVSREAAARSHTTCTWLCVCKNVAGMRSVMVPSTVFWMISAFSSPHAVRKILRAARIVATPIVMEQGGTGSLPPKLRVISSREVASMRMMREGELSDEPGSFVAMLPMRPMPRSMMSMPSNERMRCS